MPLVFDMKIWDVETEGRIFSSLTHMVNVFYPEALNQIFLQYIVVDETNLI